MDMDVYQKVSTKLIRLLGTDFTKLVGSVLLLCGKSMTSFAADAVSGVVTRLLVVK